MATRKLVVEIVGDSRQLERAFKRSAKSAQGFNREIGRFGRGGLAGSGVFRSLGRSVAFASGAFLGGVGLTAAVRAAFDEMSNAQKVSAQTSAVLRSTGGVANVTAGQVDTLATSLMNLSGVDDEVIKSGENMLLTFRNIRNQAGEGNDIFDQATKAVLDMSVAFKEDVPSAAKQLGKALQDPVRGITALRRVGIQFSDAQQKLIKHLVATGHTLEAQKIILREVNKETGGSARALGDTLAGKLNILKENVLNLAGAFVQTLTPSIGKLLDRANKWITNTENQKRVMNDLKQVAGAVKDVFNVLKGVFEGLNSITGSTKNTLKLLFGVLVAYKTLKLVSTFAGIASNIGLIGTNAATAAGTAGRLSGVLTSLSTMGPIGIAIAITVTAFTTAPFVTRQLDKLFEAAGIRTKHTPLGTGPLGGKSRPVWRHGRLVWSGSGTPYGGEDRDPGGRLAGGTRPLSQDPFATARGAFAQPPPTLPGAGGRPGGKPKFGGSFLDLLQLRVDQAALTKPLRDDLSAARRLQSYIEKLIKRYGHTYKLEQQLLQAKQQVRGILDQQKSLDEDELQKRKDTAERAKEKAKAAREALAAARAAARAAAVALREERQQRFLETGSPFVPSVKKLKDQLAQVRKLLGSAIDPATRTKLNRIAKILGGAFGAVGKAMREQLKGQLDALRDELGKSLDGGTPRGFTYGRPGVGGRSIAFAGAGVHVGTVNVYNTHNIGDLERQLTKRQAGRAHNRRGAR